MSDDDLSRALKQGNFITIGKQEGEKKPPTKVLPTIDVNVPYYSYNEPIGVDFSKSLPPLVFLTSVEILDRLADIMGVSTEIRYEAEILRGMLFQGKIHEYRQKIEQLKNNLLSSSKNNDKKEETNVQPTDLINLLYFIISKPPSSTPRWLNKTQIEKLLSTTDSLKTALKDIRTESEYSPDAVYFDLILSTILGKIGNKLSTPINPTLMQQIQLELQNRNWKKIQELLQPQASLQPVNENQSKNDVFVMLIFKLLYYLLVSP